MDKNIKNLFKFIEKFISNINILWLFFFVFKNIINFRFTDIQQQNLYGKNIFPNFIYAEKLKGQSTGKSSK